MGAGMASMTCMILMLSEFTLHTGSAPCRPFVSLDTFYFLAVQFGAKPGDLIFLPRTDSAQVLDFVLQVHVSQAERHLSSS
jgi:hypothetical protein